jgi:hypothetical protein
MNYKDHYKKLVDRAKNRKSPESKENHHIIPRCMGGTNELNNIVSLTPEEHFVAHQLLVKIYPDNKKLISALSKMCSGSSKNKRNNKWYGWIRKRFSEANSGTGNSSSKLNKEQVIEIYFSTESYKSLSKKFNVGVYQIISVKRKLTYKNVTKDILELPGFYIEGKTTRLPIPIDFIEKIFYDTGDYKYFWDTYKATERVVKSIKDKKSFKKITTNFGTPGQVKRYGMTRDTVEAIFSAIGSNKDIAAQFGIHYNTVRNIKGKNSRAWSMWEAY